MDFWEVFDIQCIYLIKLECRPSLRFLQTFLMIRDDMTLSLYFVHPWSTTCYFPGHLLFQLLLSKKPTYMKDSNI